MALAPRDSRPLPPLTWPRAHNIAWRTVHILVTGVLVGGHVFAVPKPQLLPWLYAALASGLILAVLEAYPSWRWVFEVRGLSVIGKLALLGVIPWCWNWRVPILLLLIVIAGVSSHMPARYRYYSLLEGRVVRH